MSLILELLDLTSFTCSSFIELSMSCSVISIFFSRRSAALCSANALSSSALRCLSCARAAVKVRTVSTTTRMLTRTRELLPFRALKRPVQCEGEEGADVSREERTARLCKTHQDTPSPHPEGASSWRWCLPNFHWEAL